MRRVSAPAVLYGCLALAVWLPLRAAPGAPAPARRAPAAATAPPGRPAARGRPGAPGRPAAPARRGHGGHDAAPRGRRAAAGTISTRRHDRQRRQRRQAARAARGRGGTTGSAGRGGTTGSARRDAARPAPPARGGSGQLHVHADVGDQHEDRDGRHRHLVDDARRRDVGEDRLRPDDLVRHDRAGRPRCTASNRTLLLGMKAAKMYHYRITATSSARLVPERRLHDHDRRARRPACRSRRSRPTNATAPLRRLPDHRPVHDERRRRARRRTSSTPTATTSGGTARGSDVTGARMSYDGKYMWINSANVPSGTAHVHRVSMDGMTDEDSRRPVHGPQPPAHRAARRDRRVLRLRLERLRRHQGARAERHGQDDRQRADRARRHRRLPRQQHPVLAGGRHAGVLRPRQQRHHQGHPHRHGRSGC